MFSFLSARQIFANIFSSNHYSKSYKIGIRYFPCFTDEETEEKTFKSHGQDCKANHIAKIKTRAICI